MANMCVSMTGFNAPRKSRAGLRHNVQSELHTETPIRKFGAVSELSQ